MIMSTQRGRDAWLAIALSIAFSITGCSEEQTQATQADQAMAPEANAATEVAIANTHSFEMTGSENNTTYRIFVYAPERDAAASEAKLPVIYMNDANFYFGTMVETLRNRGFGNPDFTGAMIVGVGYPDGVNLIHARGKDLTNIPNDVEVPPVFGGDTEFRSFLINELMPHIAENYSIDKEREMLFGHSFGGLFTLRTLINAPGAFDKYVAASPSLWWGDKSLLRNELADLKTNLESISKKPDILLTVAELEGTPPQTEQVKTEKPSDTERTGPPPLPGFLNRSQVRDAEELNERLANEFGLENQLMVIPGEGHTSVVPAIIAKAITFSLSE